MLFRALTTHASAESTKDEAWIRLLLHFFKAYVQDLGKMLLLKQREQVTYVTELAEALISAARDVPSGMKYHQKCCMLFLTNRSRCD